jgi:hypothetical protein
MRRAGTTALAAVAALGVAGCGGGGVSDKQKIETTVRDYFGAFADGDAAKACSDLSTTTREDFVKAARAKDCPSALAKAMQRPDIKRFTARLRNPQVVSVAINGGSATAQVRALGRTTKVPLHKEGDNWKVEGKVGESG